MENSISTLQNKTTENHQRFSGNSATRTLPAVPVLQKAESDEALQMESIIVQKVGAENELPQMKPNNTGLPDNLKSGVENLSGFSMDDVKVHYNSDKPTQLQALAYAQGTDIHVAPGQEKHLPHEAWHVVQQKQGRVQPTMQMKEGVAVNDDKGLESEADVMGKTAMQMNPRTSGRIAASVASSLKVIQREGELENLKTNLGEVNYNLVIQKRTDRKLELIITDEKLLEIANSLMVKEPDVNEATLLLVTFFDNCQDGQEFESAKNSFVQKTSKCNTQDWKTLFEITDWKIESRIKLIEAFGKKRMKLKATEWVILAQKYAAYKDKIETLTELISLEIKGDENWYKQREADTAKTSSASIANKKYTQLLYALLGEEDLSKLDEVDVSRIRGDFFSMLTLFHKHITTFKEEEDKGQGYNRNEQKEAFYLRSNPEHMLNKMYKSLAELRGEQKDAIIQPLNKKLLELQNKGNDSRGYDSDFLENERRGIVYHSRISKARMISVASAGLPRNNFSLCEQNQSLALDNTSGNYFSANPDEKKDTGKIIIKNPETEIVDSGKSPSIKKTITAQGKMVVKLDRSKKIGETVSPQIDNAKGVLVQGTSDKYEKWTVNNGSTMNINNGVILKLNKDDMVVEGSAIATMQDDLTTEKTLKTETEIKNEATKKLWDAPTIDPKIRKSRSITGEEDAMELLLTNRKEALKEKMKADPTISNFHDFLLEDRGKLVNEISNQLAAMAGSGVKFKPVGSEDHPNLLIQIPENNKKFIYNKTEYNKTETILPQIVQDFNAASNIKASVRGSFGFQRPSFADTDKSVRFWPGYAPIESIKAGLIAVVKQLKDDPTAEKDLDLDLSKFDSDTKKPKAYIEALKTAIRHSFIVLKETVPDEASVEKKRVGMWLKNRLLIKLRQAETLIDTTVTDTNRNRHFSITADMTDKLQEYAMLYTSSVMNNVKNPNKQEEQPGRFKDDQDYYNQNVLSKLEAADYKVFYLDSGEQALIIAGILANRFQTGKDETDKDVDPSEYKKLNPYFEIGVYKGAKRSNLTDDKGNAKIVHADLSPVITEGTRKKKAEMKKEIKDTWQKENGELAKADVIPILDITNASIGAIKDLGAMPNNFIVVESLTKHQQLGADKFIMGRLIAVSNKLASSDALDKTNFLDLSQKIVGPVANDAFNPLLHKIRANMDEAIYGKDI